MTAWSNASNCLAGFAALLVAEATWVGLGPRWFESAREWAGPDPGRHGAQLVAGGFFFSLLSLSLRRRRRWAWSVARTCSVIFGGLGLFALIAGSLLSLSPRPSTSATALAVRHPVEMAGGLIAVSLLIACAVFLRRPVAEEQQASAAALQEHR